MVLHLCVAYGCFCAGDSFEQLLYIQYGSEAFMRKFADSISKAVTVSNLSSGMVLRKNQLCKQSFVFTKAIKKSWWAGGYQWSQHLGVQGYSQILSNFKANIYSKRKKKKSQAIKKLSISWKTNIKIHFNLCNLFPVLSNPHPPLLGFSCVSLAVLDALCRDQVVVRPASASLVLFWECLIVQSLASNSWSWR